MAYNMQQIYPQPQQQVSIDNPSYGLNYMLNTLDRNSQTISDLQTSLRDMNKKYLDDSAKYNETFDKVMNEMLANKSKSTGNIFTDFMTNFKDAGNIGYESGVKANRFFGNLFGTNPKPDLNFNFDFNQKQDELPNINPNINTELLPQSMLESFLPSWR